MTAIAEIVGTILVCGILLKKLNDLKVLHVEWGVVRLEFARSENNSELRQIKEPKRIAAPHSHKCCR
jgi:hypothetical protein